MSKEVQPLTEERRHLRKQIGCMDGIFQLFDRQHYSKKLLQGVQYQLDPQNAKEAPVEKDLEMQNEKPRTSMESSRPSYSSSSSYLSTFSSFDSNLTAQTEKLPSVQVNIPESPHQMKNTKEQNRSLAEDMKPHELRDVMEGSMYREARGLSIKSLASDKRKGPVMKHIDSPRPLEQPKNPKHERLEFSRFSCDGREFRETFKSAMKLKESPRYSLDSKTSYVKRCSLQNSNSNQGVSTNQEPGSQIQSSSVVAKLMGLDAIPNTVSTRIPKINSCPEKVFLTYSSISYENGKQNHITCSTNLSRNNPASPSPRLLNANFSRKPTTCSTFSVEPAPWRKQETSKGSHEMARKAPKDTMNHSSPVYGEVEKRITQLEFNKSRKDLRDLKQILDTMQKTRAGLENQTRKSAELVSQRRYNLEDRCSVQSRKSKQQIPTIKRSFPPKQSGSSIAIMKSTKEIDQANILNSTQVRKIEIMHLHLLQTQGPKYHRENSAHIRKVKDTSPRNLKDLTLLENCDTLGRSFRTLSPRLPKSTITKGGQFPLTTPSLNQNMVKGHSIKQVVQGGSPNRKHKVKTKDLQSRDDNMSEHSSDSRCSSYQSETNNNLASPNETEAISLAHSTTRNAGQKEISVATSRERMPEVESALTVLEQPSPISVLDVYYSEDPPSPVKKISIAFQDESPSPDEAERHIENVNHPTECARSDHDYKYDQQIEIVKHLVHGLRSLNVPDETTAHQNASVGRSLKQDHRCDNETLLLTPGLLKEANLISPANQLLSSCHPINPDMFHVLAQIERIMEGAKRELIGEKEMMLNPKTHRKIVFDMVNEILHRKVYSGRLFKVGRGSMTIQGLLKEVYLEIECVQRMSEDKHDDENDELITILTADMTCQSEDWENYSGEVPPLVLDIERAIFKDLVNEVITGEIMGLAQCRQLFTK